MILLVVDVQTGVTRDDAALVRRLRTAPVPVVLVANKADSPKDGADVAELYRLGLGEPIPVSALHGEGTGDLLDRVVPLLPAATDDARQTQEPPEPRFVIVGRPNVGKSSLFNRLVGQDRSVVSEVAGTTRDSVDSLVTWPGHGPVRFVDTAGMRRGQCGEGHRVLQLPAGGRLDRRGGRRVARPRCRGRPHDRGQEDREPCRRGRVAACSWSRTSGTCVEDKARRSRTLTAAAGPFADATVVRVSAASRPRRAAPAAAGRGSPCGGGADALRPRGSTRSSAAPSTSARRRARREPSTT